MPEKTALLILSLAFIAAVIGNSVGKAHFSTFHIFAPTGTPECLRSSANDTDD
jgi:hypothetical protein